MNLVSTLLQDATADSSSTLGRPIVLADHFTIRSVATVLYRLSQVLGETAPLLGSAVKQLNNLVTGADIAWQAKIGPGLMLYHPTGVVIGPHCVVGPRCEVQSSVTIGGGADRSGGPGDSPTIGADCELGAGCRVIGRVTIGDRSVVGANAVVTRDVPADSIAVGVPARSRPRDSKEEHGSSAT